MHRSKAVIEARIAKMGNLGRGSRRMKERGKEKVGEIGFP